MTGPINTLWGERGGNNSWSIVGNKIEEQSIRSLALLPLGFSGSEEIWLARIRCERLTVRPITSHVCLYVKCKRISGEILHFLSSFTVSHVVRQWLVQVCNLNNSLTLRGQLPNFWQAVVFWLIETKDRWAFSRALSRCYSIARHL